MTRFKVDLDELDRVVGSLDSFGKTLSTKLAELQEALDALQKDWQGEAADAQAEVHRKLATGAQEMHTALLGLHAAARHAHGSYLGAVRANQQTWEQLR